MEQSTLVQLIQGSFQQAVTLLKEYGLTKNLKDEWGYYNELRNAARDRSYLPWITRDVRKMLLEDDQKSPLATVSDTELEVALTVFLESEVYQKESKTFWEFYEKNLVPK